MATITKSYRETSDDDGGVSYGLRGYSTWTFSLTGSNMTVSTSSFVPTTTMTAKYVCPSNYSVISNMGKVESAFFLKIGNTQLMEVHHDKSRTDGYMRGEVDMRNNTVYTTSVTERYPASISTSSVFNSSNSTSITATIGAYNSFLSFSSSYNGSNLCSGYQYSDTGSSWGNLFTVTLDAPPTFNSTQVSFINDYDGDAYVGLTTAKVTLSSLSAKYGGTISSATLTIGNQTATRTSNGVLSILLDSAGTFTPTVTVTDSRGQTTTKTLDAITVNPYVAPEVSFTLERTNSSGTVDDEGTYAVATASFNWTDAIATLSQPTVSAIDSDGTPLSVSATWYTDRALTTAVNWSDTSSWSSPKTLYGRIGTLPVNESSQVTITPNDSEGSGTAQTQTLASAFYTIDFLAGGHGIAFGQPASKEGFFCNMDSHFSDKAHVMRALFDFVYPVGSYYETSDTTFNPNVTWGGTWELETQGQVHISSGANYSVSGALTNTTDGGSKDAVVIYHTHKVSSGWQSASGQPDRITYSGVNGGYNNAGYGGVQFLESVGVNGTDKNLQPYIIVKRWHRTA